MDYGDGPRVGWAAWTCEGGEGATDGNRERKNEGVATTGDGQTGEVLVVGAESGEAGRVRRCEPIRSLSGRIGATLKTGCNVCQTPLSLSLSFFVCGLFRFVAHLLPFFPRIVPFKGVLGIGC